MHPKHTHLCSKVEPGQHEHMICQVYPFYAVVLRKRTEFHVHHEDRLQVVEA